MVFWDRIRFYLFEVEHTCMQGLRGRGDGTGLRTEGEGEADSLMSREPEVGLTSRTQEIMT